jgi:hypothetical protein
MRIVREIRRHTDRQDIAYYEMVLDDGEVFEWATPVRGHYLLDLDIIALQAFIRSLRLLKENK